MVDDDSFSFQVEPADRGKRLDTIVSETIEDVSRSVAAQLIQRRLINVNGASKKPGYKVKIADRVDGRIPPPIPLTLSPEPLPLSVIYEDDTLIVVDKPAGTVVHPGAGHHTGTLVNALLHHCPDLKGIGGVERPGIVHRLDKNTSGLLIVAKTHQAHLILSHMFKERQIYKEYLAIVHGRLASSSGTTTLAIGRHPTDRKKMSVTSKNGRPSETLWQLEQQFNEHAIVKCVLKTGRTHQIRVHLAAMNHPIVGDDMYGTFNPKRLDKISRQFYETHVKGITRQMLHARKLCFEHPVLKTNISLESAIPPDMADFIHSLRTPFNCS